MFKAFNIPPFFMSYFSFFILLHSCPVLLNTGFASVIQFSFTFLIPSPVELKRRVEMVDRQVVKETYRKIWKVYIWFKSNAHLFYWSIHPVFYPFRGFGKEDCNAINYLGHLHSFMYYAGLFNIFFLHFKDKLY